MSEEAAKSRDKKGRKNTVEADQNLAETGKDRTMEKLNQQL